MGIPKPVVVNACRVCGGSLEVVGSLGDIALSDFQDKPFEPIRMPLEMKFCKSCSLPQLGHNTPRELLYDKYWYRSGLNQAIVDDLKEIAEWGRGTHIDIGANDGTLLKYSQAINKIAIDPSDIKSDFPFVKGYWEDVDLGEKADVITAIACLYDLPDPTRFMHNIKRHLKDDGVFICQLMTLQPMLDNNDLGNICHEHLLYYSYSSLGILFRQADMEIFKVKHNAMNGGSYRIFARALRYASVYLEEPRVTADAMKRFLERVDQNRKDFALWSWNEREVVGYGASTKMATITGYYDIKPSIIVDVNPEKIGKYTVDGAKVVGEIPEDTLYLWVFPYGFLDYFKARETNYKGKWVTTMPKFKIC